MREALSDLKKQLNDLGNKNKEHVEEYSRNRVQHGAKENTINKKF